MKQAAPLALSKVTVAVSPMMAGPRPTLATGGSEAGYMAHLARPRETPGNAQAPAF